MHLFHLFFFLLLLHLSLRFSFGVVSYFEYIFFLCFFLTLFAALMPYYYYCYTRHSYTRSHRRTKQFVCSFVWSAERMVASIAVFPYSYMIFSKAESRYPFLVFTSLDFEYNFVRVSSFVAFDFLFFSFLVRFNGQIHRIHEAKEIDRHHHHHSKMFNVFRERKRRNLLCSKILVYHVLLSALSTSVRVQ